MALTHVIVGKGPVGATLAARLAADGESVTIVSRSGAPKPSESPTRASHPEVRHVAADAADPEALVRATRGADVIHNCANPPYHRWATDWPPLAAALLDAAETHGALLVTTSNLYGYGRIGGPMTEDLPLAATETKGRVRAAMWRAALSRHQSGRVRVSEIRASDYVGPGALATSHVGDRLLAPLLAGRTVRPVGSADQPHTWTYLPDLARTLAAVARTPAAWGRAWHAPSPAPRTFREVAAGFAEAAGVPVARISPVPLWALRAAGVVDPTLREVARVGHQLTAPFVMDSRNAQDLLAIEPTPWDQIDRETIAWWCTR